MPSHQHQSAPPFTEEHTSLGFEPVCDLQPWGNAAAVEELSCRYDDPVWDAVAVIERIASQGDASPADQGNAVARAMPGLGSAPPALQAECMARVELAFGQQASIAFLAHLQQFPRHPYEDAIQVDRNALGALGPGYIAPGLAAAAVATNVRGVAFVDGFVDGLEQQLDAETVAGVVVALAAGGSFTGTFPPVFFAGVLHGAVADIGDTLAMLADLGAVIDGIEALAESLLSPDGEAFARALGQDLAGLYGGDVAGLAGKDPVSVSYWMGQKVGPLVTELLLGLATGGAVVLAKRASTVINATADGLGAVSRLRQLASAASPELPYWALADGPGAIPEWDTPQHGGPGRRQDEIDLLFGRDPHPLDGVMDDHDRASMQVRDLPPDKRLRLPAGTSSADLLVALTGPRASFRPYLDMLHRLGIDDATGALRKIEARIGGTKATREVDLDTLRPWLKAEYHDHILQKLTDPARTPQQRHGDFLHHTHDLNSADRGNLAERWYQAEYAPDAEAHGRLPARPVNDQIKADSPLDLEAGMLGNRVPDLIEGDAMIEIKSHRGELDEHSILQIDDYQRALSSGKAVVNIGGTSREVRELVVVFIHPDGAQANLEHIRSWGSWNPPPSIEVFNHSGTRKIFDANQLEKIEEFLNGG